MENDVHVNKKILNFKENNSEYIPPSTALQIMLSVVVY